MSKSAVVRIRRNKAERGEAREIELTVRLDEKKAVAPYRTIDGDPCKSYTELSIVGSVWFFGDRWDDPSCVGQCVEDVRRFVEHISGDPTAEPLLALCELWERWHLNGMQPGSRKQRDYLVAHPPEPAVYPASTYDAHCEALKAADLYEDRSAQWLLVCTSKLDEPKGYTYGSAWLVELLPAEVEEHILDVCRACAPQGAEGAQS